MTERNRPFVTIVMPALNEERHIALALATIVPEEGAAFDYEIIVADGGSNDRTAQIVALISRGRRDIRLINNVGRTQAAGMNFAARSADARSAILVRADCHASYPPGFVSICVSALQSSGASSVVVPMVTAGSSPVQGAIAAAQNSRIGNGGAAHRLSGGRSAFVNHGHHAAFDRATFLAVGGYDETFPANEDAEYDARVIAAGGRIWMCGEAEIVYFPRSSFRSLAVQYARYGTGRAKTVRRTGARLRLRQSLPIISLLGCSASLASGLFDPLLAVPALAYATGCLAWGGGLAVRARRPSLAMAGIAAMVMHMAWAFGFLRGWAASTRHPHLAAAPGLATIGGPGGST